LGYFLLIAIEIEFDFPLILAGVGNGGTQLAQFGVAVVDDFDADLEDLFYLGESLLEGTNFGGFTRVGGTKVEGGFIRDVSPCHCAAGFEQFAVEGDDAMFAE
jgi:hypothetical protein